MFAVVLSRTGRIEKLIVLLDKRMAAIWSLPNPLLESVFDGLLLLLSKRCFFGVKNPPLLAVSIGYSVVNPHVTQIQRILDDLVGICTFCTVGVMNVDVARIHAFSGYIPLRSDLGIFKTNFSSQIKRRIKEF